MQMHVRLGTTWGAAPRCHPPFIVLRQELILAWHWLSGLDRLARKPKRSTCLHLAGTGIIDMLCDHAWLLRVTSGIELRSSSLQGSVLTEICSQPHIFAF